ncbi:MULTISPECIES: SRPBCC family protein [Meridianimaribacter]|uniref:Polyketide cyclase/dehydrase/lipid transport protein n=1 Tax=Meridianimaribacter flavus TaxID=571115 RepID=A0ABY2G515_9FLAO|nr:MULTISPECIES: SRPBCC family protein [Meridianimaribacter]TBV25628.1 polyketide cyclase [Meridianimaribacter sp. CL38]TDY11911.1 polyketide cyclase/dehydrase/lipid transport protein [Meridianimaribacter flavus]
MIIALYVILGIIALIIILALIAPKAYDVNRSIVINAPKDEVFKYLTFIKNQNDWSPWKKKDPNMKQEFIGTDGEVGFISKWEGNKDVGTGEQELISIQKENDKIEVQLRFFKPWKSQSVGYYTVEELNTNETKVVWGFQGKNPIPFNVFMLFFNFEKAVGKDFDEGLTSLKHILEGK